jgi:hypothetical protein
MKYPAEDPRLWFEDIDAGDSRMLMLEGLFEGLARRGAVFTTLEVAAREYDQRKPLRTG